MRDIPDLFRGREDCHGAYGLLNNRTTDRGKKTGQAATRRQPVTPELWAAHLAGQQRLGIVPVLKNGTCWWFCLDVDHYQDEGLLPLIAARIDELSLPLVMTRSKSGGAHLWCFLSEPMDANAAIAVALSFKKRLALPEEHVDIFPAQGKASDIGNWMNMPYFGAQCHGAGIDGLAEQTVDEFVHYANERIVHPSDIGLARKQSATRVTGGKMPPCIAKFFDEGCIPEGGRNNMMTHIGVYYKKAEPDDWEEKLKEANEEYCDPELPRDEMRNVIKSLKSKDFAYFCKKVPAEYCDREACKKCEFGIGSGSTDDENPLPIDSITKLNGEKPIYKIVAATGVTFTITLDEIFNYQKFRTAFLGAADIFLVNMKNDEWRDRLTVYLERMAHEDAAPDTQMGERVFAQFQRFAARCDTTSLSHSFESGLAFYDEPQRTIIFRGDDFMQLIDRALKLDREKTWAYMREAGCDQKDYEIGGKTEKLWCFKVTGDLWFNPHEGDQA